MRALRAELSKLVSLPSAWIAAAVGLLVPVGVAVMNARSQGAADEASSSVLTDAGYSAFASGVIGAIILGVVAVSSEYATEGDESAASRQITTTLTAVPGRTALLLAKLVAVGLVTLGLAAVASAVAFAGIHLTVGDGGTGPAIDASRSGGVLVFWVLTAWLASGLTTLIRSGIVPMAVLLVNSSFVSVSLLLTKVTTAANYLPDVAGLRMFVRDFDSDIHVAPITGGLVMAIWILTLLAIAAVVFRRRDA